jgi:3-oxoacyl-[acyl-carrier protein] reductase
MSVKKVALVTGAGKGLGREIAVSLADMTAGIAVHYLKNRMAAEETARLIRQKGKASFTVRADLTREKEAAGLIRNVEQRLGRVDILVNNVGPILMKPWTELTAADWDRMLRANVESAFFCLKAALPGMRQRKWGRIINIGYSRAEQLAAFPTITAYAAAKTSLLILTRTAAVAEAGSGVTINMVSPGLLEGGLLPSGLKIEKMVLGMFADVAKAVCFLASDEARAVRGTNLIVAGTWKM